VSDHATVPSRSPDLSATADERRVVTAAIATPLAAELIASIRGVGDRVSVLYQPELMPPTRYPGDHRGVEGFRRDPEKQSRWQEMLAQAEVLFGIPGDSPEGLAAAVRGNLRLRWVQGTAAGTGEQLKAAGLTRTSSQASRSRARAAYLDVVGGAERDMFEAVGVLTLAKEVQHILTRPPGDLDNAVVHFA
jgi:hypothetical protein